MSFPHNNEGRKVITDMYDFETCKEIVNNGCISGVCSQHILYVDTISFFDKYEAEILSEVTEILGVDTLVDIFKEHDACYDAYRNDVTWTFIELVAMDVVTEMERIEYEQDELIESYMLPVDLQESAEDLMNLSVVTNVIKDGNNLKLEGINPPQSMNLNRYSHA